MTDPEGHAFLELLHLEAAVWKLGIPARNPPAQPVGPASLCMDTARKLLKTKGLNTRRVWPAGGAFAALPSYLAEPAGEGGLRETVVRGENQSADLGSQSGPANPFVSGGSFESEQTFASEGDTASLDGRSDCAAVEMAGVEILQEGDEVITKAVREKAVTR